jgi:hypothetical protein
VLVSRRRPGWQARDGFSHVASRASKRAAFAAVDAARGPCDQLRRWCLVGRTASGPKREHGADDPNGAKTVTAPATVSGKRAPMSLGDREDGARTLREAASQETCHQAGRCEPSMTFLSMHGGCCRS